MQVIGRRSDEATVLRVVTPMEQATEWRAAAPAAGRRRAATSGDAQKGTESPNTGGATPPRARFA